MPEHPLKALRQSRGITQTQLAELAGISQPSVARIEADGHLAYGVVLAKVAQALDVSVSEIAGPNQLELARVLDRKQLVASWLGLDEESSEIAHIRSELAA